MLAASVNAAVVLPGALMPMATAAGGSAPVVESSGSTNFVNNTALTSTNIVTTSGANRCLFVHCAVGDSSFLVVGPTAMTYNGVALTKIWQTNGTTFVRSDGWVLVNPATGANSLIVTYGATAADQTCLIWVNLTGVNQTTPNDTAAVQGGSGTAPAVTVASAANDLVLCGVVTDAENTLTVNVGTQILKVQNVGSDTDYGVSQIAGAASVSPSWTTGSDNFAIGGASFNPP